MDTEAAAAFWSYTHKDDEAEDGRIVQLAHDLQAQYGMLTGSNLALFLDKDKIEWGDNLRARIDQALAGTTFFIPILTPRYFASDECRRELIAFSQEMKRLNVESLLLPVYYADVAGLTAQEDLNDSAMLLVTEYKWEDWRSLCLEDASSSEYRKGVRRLAERLVQVVRELTQDSASSTTGAGVPTETPHDSGDSDDSPGLIDLIADGEEAFPEWNRIIQETSPEIEEVGDLATEASKEIAESDARGGGAAGRLKVAIRLAERMKPHADTILRLGQEGGLVLLRVDPAINALLDEIESDPKEALHTDGVSEFMEAIRGLAQSGKGAVGSLQELSASFDQSAKLSRALRPPIRDMQNGLRGFMDAQAIFDAWDKRLDVIERLQG